MSKTISQAIEEIQARIQTLEEEARPLKLQVNTLCGIDGIPVIYPDADQMASLAHKSRGPKIKVDEFISDKMARAVRRYLQMRREADPDNGPALIEEIKDALLDGGFDFRGKEPMQALSISLGKSTHTFKKVNKQGHFGLAEWYGGVTRTRSKSSNAAVASQEDIDGDDDGDADVESLADQSEEEESVTVETDV